MAGVARRGGGAGTASGTREREQRIAIPIKEVTRIPSTKRQTHLFGRDQRTELRRPSRFDEARRKWKAGGSEETRGQMAKTTTAVTTVFRIISTMKWKARTTVSSERVEENTCDKRVRPPVMEFSGGEGVTKTRWPSCSRTKKVVHLSLRSFWCTAGTPSNEKV